MSRWMKIGIIAAVLAIPTAAYAGTRLMAAACSCDECPCGSGCPCGHG